VDWFFLSHRLPIALEAIKQGYEVHIATSITDKLEELLSHGLIVHPVDIGRSSTSLISESRAFFDILRVLKSVRPHIAHLITIKPVIFGGIAARIAGVPAIVAAISGLGFVFLAKGLRAVAVRSLVAGLYRLALGKRNLKVIFQNPDDCDTLTQVVGLPSEKAIVIRGSGVDLSVYTASPHPKGVPLVVMAARLLRDKGVHEFVSAVQILKKAGVAARFWLVGDLDPGNPTSVNEADLSVWRNEGAVELLGHRHDIASVFAQSHVVVLPSYREGLPRVLIEAAACGRAVVTTDVPGCRDAIEPDVTGLLVPPRDAVALADAIQRLLLDEKMCERMGQAGRKLAEREFAVEKVVSTHLDVYRDLLEVVA
jgi:glycosyltransferase involved in cell wall biosynthesis